MATDENLFPSVMRQIPSLWVEVENYLELRGSTMQVRLFFCA